MARPTKWTGTVLDGKNERIGTDTLITELVKHYNLSLGDIGEKNKELVVAMAKDLKVPAFMEEKYYKRMLTCLERMEEIVIWFDIKKLSYIKNLSIENAITLYLSKDSSLK